MSDTPANSRTFLEERTGRLSQIGGITPFVHDGSKAKGVSTLRVRTGRGLEFWVIPDRGMDILEASFRGVSLSWHSPTGVTHPAYFSNRGIEWLRGFFGGLLTTCGLSTAGAPSVDNGETLGLHGYMNNTPAEPCNWTEEWKGDDCIFTISGKVREASVFGPNLVLERTITTSLASSSFTVKDVVENQGIAESPLMLLYHWNFGFPLLTDRSQIHVPSVTRDPSTPVSAASAERWNLFEEPQRGIDERVYFHSMRPDADGRVTAVLVSDRERPEFGIALSYDASTLPEFIEWKLTGVNHYVLGLEPANCRSLGRKAERERGTLQFLKPGERHEFHTELRVLEGAEEVIEAVRKTAL
ncbi:MAG TPA: aldose 1-epimerase family protein [Granulicella sp.]